MYGDLMVDDIETVNVENFNGILRERLGGLFEGLSVFQRKNSACIAR